MKDWLRALHEELRVHGAPVVRVVVATVRGSAPREPGACMLVTPTGELGTIGGGHLELVATRIARAMLDGMAESTRLDRFSLGASLGQCCGGIVELWFQRYDPDDAEPLAEAMRLRGDGSSPEAIAALASRDPRAARYERFSPELTHLWLFGAGHVGRALVNVLAPLPFAITWIDSREGMLPADPPANVRGIHSPDPAGEVRDMGADTWALVMTHSHDEDFSICQALLGHGRSLDSAGASRPRDSAGASRPRRWAGVIGSLPKAARFRQRLLQRGYSADEISHLTMPIGIGGIRSKEAAAIAVAVAAQLLQVREARAIATDHGQVTAARES